MALAEPAEPAVPAERAELAELAELAAAIAPPDLDAQSAIGVRAPEVSRGTLRDIAGWCGSVQGSATPRSPTRVRLVRFGFGPQAAPPAAGDGDVRDVAHHTGDLASAVALGAQVADDEIDSGADLLIVTVARNGVAAEVLTAALTNAEPVKVLPRGTALAPTEWMARAELVRDGRRRAIAARDSVAALLGTVDDGDIAAAAAFLLRAAGRRTGVLLDGFAALAAALAAFELQPRAPRWYRVADSSGSPADELALTRLGQRALLELGTDLEDGTAGLLAAIVVRFAIEANTGGGRDFQPAAG